jgi:phage repressor protein C with HTH and peptisase S24 domain
MGKIAIEMAGESMIPTIQPGTRLLGEVITGPDQIRPGEIYIVVDKNGEQTVRRVVAMENGIVLTSDHQNQQLYPPYARTWDQIQAIFKVTAFGNKH